MTLNLCLISRILICSAGKVYMLTLEVNNSSNIDSGSYIVVAENEKGKATSTINLKFDQGQLNSMNPY